MKIFLLFMQLLPSIMELVKKLDEIVPKSGAGEIKGLALSQLLTIGSNGNTELTSMTDKAVPVIVEMLKAAEVK